MPGDWTFYMAAVPAVVLLGLSKGGFSGLSTLAMPLLALAISPVRAAAIVLPILIVQDWVSVWAFRRDFNVRNLVILIPAALIGIAAGWLLAARVERSGGAAGGRADLRRVRRLHAAARPPRGRPRPRRRTSRRESVWGALAGFTSFVSHAGAPPVMVYVMPQKLAPRVFAGTATMFFAAVNLLESAALFPPRPVQRATI